MDYEEYRQYRNENYPDLYPCKNCVYWKGASGGSRDYPSLPICSYLLLTGHKRNCIPDFINETCEKFERRKKSR